MPAGVDWLAALVPQQLIGTWGLRRTRKKRSEVVADSEAECLSPFKRRSIQFERSVSAPPADCEKANYNAALLSKSIGSKHGASPLMVFLGFSRAVLRSAQLRLGSPNRFKQHPQGEKTTLVWRDELPLAGLHTKKHSLLREMEQPNAFCRCSGCKNPDGYCATYIGPLFDETEPKVLFIGLDIGKDGNGDPNAHKWQKRLLAYYREEGNHWNPHYKGCIFVAADILGAQCKETCRESCSKYSHDLCALTHFAQGNAVKCVASGNGTMEFKSSQKKLIPYCLPLIFEEAATMRPDVIVLQGYKKELEDPFYDLLRRGGAVGNELLDVGEKEYAGIMTWSGLPRKKSIIVHMHHPSARLYRGRFDKYMDHVAPRLRTIHKWFETASDITLAQKNP